MTVRALKTNNMAFKMKGSPMQRNFGIGGSPVRKNEKTDVTKQYEQTGNEEIRKAIKEGAKVYKDKSGKITVSKPAPTQMGLKHFTTKERIH